MRTRAREGLPVDPLVALGAVEIRLRFAVDSQ